MANQKISQLTAGAPAQTTDELVVARSGSNFRLFVSDVIALFAAAFGFNSITTGTNTGQTLTVGNGTTLAPSGTGVIEANEIEAIAAASISNPTGDVAVSAATPTAIIIKSVTMPSVGGPWRAFVGWELGATTSNSGGVEGWVNDGTNNFATGGSNTTGSVGPPTQFHLAAASFSPVTYANGANVTFTLKVESEQAITVRQASQMSPQEAYLNVVLFPST